MQFFFFFFFVVVVVWRTDLEIQGLAGLFWHYQWHQTYLLSFLCTVKWDCPVSTAVKWNHRIDFWPVQRGHKLHLQSRYVQKVLHGPPFLNPRICQGFAPRATRMQSPVIEATWVPESAFGLRSHKHSDRTLSRLDHYFYFARSLRFWFCFC